MKKGLIFISLLCAVFMVGCQTKEENLKVYEMHLYDSTFKHTEELIAKYKEDGSLKYLEYYMVYDSEKACEYAINNWNENAVDAKYEEVKFNCETVDGKTTVSWSMTDKSIEDGYLIDDEDYDSSLKSYYERIKTEEMAKETFEGQVTRFKEENLFGDERNYIIINGERIDS